MLNRYVIKKLILGYHIGLESPDFYVGVTQKKLNHSCMVIYQGEENKAMNGYMVIKKGTKPLKSLHVAGIGGLPDHTLCYFKWKPYIKKEEIRNVIQTGYMKLSKEQKNELRQKLGLKPI